MNRKRILILIGIATFIAAGWAMAKDKEGPITGTWECQAKGSPQGDMDFTLYLQQNQEDVDGNVYSPIGSARITSGTFKNDTLEIHIDTEEGNYLLIAKFDKGALSGTWSKDTDKGTWTGKKQASGPR